MAVQVTNNSSTVVVKAAGIQGATGATGASGSLNVDINSLATTGSNSFTGDQIISGSLTISGSSTLTNIGPAIFSGSLNVTSSFTASGLNYPSVDGIDGSVIVSDGLGNLSMGHGERLVVQVRNNESFTITAGTPLHAVGSVGGSQRVLVVTASADSSNTDTMPAFGIAATDLTPTGDTKDGFAVTTGIFPDYNFTLAPGSITVEEGHVLYVGQNGGLTNVKPDTNDQNLIQNVGIVLKTNGTLVQNFQVSAINRTNDVPNLNQGNIFFGSGSNYAKIHISGALDQTAINNITASGNISASGNVFGTTFGDSSGNIVFAGNVSGSGANSSYFGKEFNATGDDGNSGFTLLSLTDKPSFFTFNNIIYIGSTHPSSTHKGINLNAPVTASGNMSASNASFKDTITIRENATGNGLQFSDNLDKIYFDGTNIVISVDDEDQYTFRPSGLDIQGHLSASGNITASKFIGGGLEIEGPSSIKIDSETFGMEIFGSQIEMGGRDESKLMVISGQNGSGTGRIVIGDGEFDFNGAHLDIEVGKSAAHFDGLNITSSLNIKADGHGLFQAGKPIVTHTSDFSASLANAGKYHIVGGDLTCSIANFTGQVAPVGAEFEFFQTSSAGNFLFESGSGITVISKNDSLRLAQLGSSAVLKKVATTTFHLMGDLT